MNQMHEHMRTASYLLPDPGGAVVRDLLDQLTAVTAERDDLLARAEAAEEKLEKVRTWAYEMIPDCSCSEGYTVRRLVDPSCHYHDLDVETLDAILAPGGGEPNPSETPNSSPTERTEK